MQAKAKAAAPSSSGGKSAKKKKWSKGKVKDKAQHAVVLDKATYDRIFKEVPTFRFISQSILIERLKVNGSLARVAIRHLEKEGLIKRIVHHSGQLIYSMIICFLYIYYVSLYLVTSTGNWWRGRERRRVDLSYDMHMYLPFYYLLFKNPNYHDCCIG